MEILNSTYQLDLLRLIFPLFPFALSYALLYFPHIVQEFSETAVNFGSLALEVGYMIFQWMQVAFQVIGVSEILSTANKKETFRASKFYFLILANLNFWIWLNWTLECQLRAIHGGCTDMFGTFGSIFIIYATLTFVLLNFIHVTAIFLDLYSQSLV